MKDTSNRQHVFVYFLQVKKFPIRMYTSNSKTFMFLNSCKFCLKVTNLFDMFCSYGSVEEYVMNTSYQIIFTIYTQTLQTGFKQICGSDHANAI